MLHDNKDKISVRVYMILVQLYINAGGLFLQKIFSKTFRMNKA